MGLRWRVRSLMVATAVVGVGLSFLPASVPQGRACRRAYQQGRAEADAQWKAGKACLYTYGLRAGFENVDEETGLPCEAIAGCLVNDTILGRAAGHGDRIAELIRANGPPKNSFLRWKAELFALRDYFESRTGREEPKRLAPGGAPLRSPDGRHVVRPVSAPTVKDDGKPGEVLALVIGEGPQALLRLVLYGDEGRSDLAWGPEGSGFAVIRCRSEKRDEYRALDLIRGGWLRGEFVETVPAGGGT